MSLNTDAALETAIESSFREWQEEHGLNPAVPVAWVLIVEGTGFKDDGADVEQVMIVPHASRPHAQGLLKHATDRFTGETLAVYGGAHE